MKAGAQLALLPELHRAARQVGHDAGDRAAARNERSNPGWVDAAVLRLRAFAKHAPGVWTMEQAREVIGAELPDPTDLRAWGVVTRLAARREFIAQVRGVYIAAVSSHGSAKPAYRKGAKA